MSASSIPDLQHVLTEIFHGLTDSVGDRPGETDAQRASRQQVALFSAMAFLPRDGAETILSGQCVLFNLLFQDAVRDALSGPSHELRRRLRPQAASLGRAFLKHLDHLLIFQARPEDQLATMPIAADDPPSAAAKKPPSPTSPVPDPPEPFATMKHALLARRGFQNRRERRASQKLNKTPTHAAPSGGTVAVAATPRSTADPPR